MTRRVSSFFILDMFRKLENGSKNGYDQYEKRWENDDITDATLFCDLEAELRELETSLHTCKVGSQEIIDECADVANFAMFIADWHRNHPAVVAGRGIVGLKLIQREL